MKGYLGNEAATKDCLKEDGWFHSGDLGHFDREGNLFVSDRLKELVREGLYYKRICEFVYFFLAQFGPSVVVG